MCSMFVHCVPTCTSVSMCVNVCVWYECLCMYCEYAWMCLCSLSSACVQCVCLMGVCVCVCACIHFNLSINLFGAQKYVCLAVVWKRSVSVCGLLTSNDNHILYRNMCFWLQ